MKKYLEAKFFIVLLACVGLAALVLLSIALRDFHFPSVEPFSINLLSGGPPSLAQARTGLEIPVWKFLLFGVLLLIIFAVLLVLMDPEARKRLLFKLFRFVMTLLGIWILINYAYERGSLNQLMNLMPSGDAAGGTTAQTKLPVYVPPQINFWLVFAASFVVGLALVLFVWFIYRRLARPRSLPPLQDIADIAREALQALQPGHDWDEAIVRAYIRMNQVVTAERGLVRQPGVTPSEFARRMEHAGLPGEAVSSLTHLFEGVRYGGKNSSLADRDLAAAALSAIYHACQVKQ
jgi:hypothetical protein